MVDLARLTAQEPTLCKYRIGAFIAYEHTVISGRIARTVHRIKAGYIRRIGLGNYIPKRIVCKPAESERLKKLCYRKAGTVVAAFVISCNKCFGRNFSRCPPIFLLTYYNIYCLPCKMPR